MSIGLHASFMQATIRWVLMFMLASVGFSSAALSQKGEAKWYFCTSNVWEFPDDYADQEMKFNLVSQLFRSDADDDELHASWNQQVANRGEGFRVGPGVCYSTDNPELREWSRNRYIESFTRYVDFKAPGLVTGDTEPDVEEVVHDERGNTASLAIDQRNGSRYGWAVDYADYTGSDARALRECKEGGLNCFVVLRFTGGCGAFAADQARGSTAYGWGTALTREDAEARASEEARKRGATRVVTRVWGCNSTKNATSEMRQTSSQQSREDARKAREAAYQKALEDYNDGLRAHEEAVARREKEIEDDRIAAQQAAARARAQLERHAQEVAQARAAQEQYERERAAYREEYKRLTGVYPPN